MKYSPVIKVGPHESPSISLLIIDTSMAALFGPFPPSCGQGGQAHLPESTFPPSVTADEL